ncbi:MAG: TonB-dependent receptor, partial [Ignavibacteria bacterium]|nr:TonB-dependent receptor [Ignavibacteria bacterium]
SAKSNVFRSEVQLNYFFQPKNKLTFGIAGDYSVISSNVFGNPYSFGAAFFAQNEWKPFEELKATLGFRFDYQKVDTALSESQFSPKFGLNYQLNENLILRLSAGRGYRAPSAAEMFTSTRAAGITVRPNPNLKSESSWSFEIGSNYSFSNWLNFDLALFQNEYYDLIEPGFDERGEVIFRNITRARIQGLESGFTFTPIENFWNLNVGYTYLWARDTKLNQFLKYRPRHLLYLTNVLRYDFIELGIDFRYWNRIENIDEEFIKLGIIQDGELRDKVLVTDLRLSFDLIHFSLPMRAYFSVNNLFNYNYIELIGNLAPIRNFVLTIESIL